MSAETIPQSPDQESLSTSFAQHDLEQQLAETRGIVEQLDPRISATGSGRYDSSDLYKVGDTGPSVEHQHGPYGQRFDARMDSVEEDGTLVGTHAIIHNKDGVERGVTTVTRTSPEGDVSVEEDRDSHRAREVGALALKQVAQLAQNQLENLN